MAVTFDSSATGIARLSTTGSASATHNVSPTAPDLYAIVAVYWSGDEDASSATLGVTFGGHAMTEVTDGQVFWNSSDATIGMYYLADPPTGAQTVTATLGTNLGSGLFGLASATYSGVASVGSATTSSGSADASLVVSSAHAQSFVNAFAARVSTGSFSDYSGTSRANLSYSSGNEPLIIGDDAGAGPMNFTATVPTTDLVGWGGIGVGLIANTTVTYDATGAGFTGLTQSPSWSHTISSTATALVVVVETDCVFTPDTVTARVGSTPMTLLGSVNFYPYPASQNLYMFGLMYPPTGTQTVTVNMTGVAPVQAYMAANSVSYVGVTAFDTDSFATITGQSDTVTVPSTVPAARVVAAHALSAFNNTFTYNQAKRAVVSFAAGQQVLLLGDAPGAFAVTSSAGISPPSATQFNSADWGVVGVNLTPAIVDISASVAIPVATSARLNINRVAEPSPLRTWLIES